MSALNTSAIPASFTPFNWCIYPERLLGYNCFLSFWGLRSLSCISVSKLSYFTFTPVHGERYKCELRCLCLIVFQCTSKTSFVTNTVLSCSEEYHCFPKLYIQGLEQHLHVFQGLNIFWTWSKIVARPVFPLIFYNSSGKSG